ncbi:SH3 domain-containing protein [Tenacibaculum jejuense]|uniref:SH3b domain-containing protein n=1 Tax=Tenacibaculum jejuense TaxID=584609 RepID=A0A238UA82_9FLAO|nr:hypothetical protein [Tenacibaculum jejuense]SNR15985.1 protein of unknown function [Tenacibaculum jejuense]
MKKYIVLGFISPLLVSLFFFPKNETEIKMLPKYSSIKACYVSTDARCTGSSYCRACKNCSRCKYCNNGGSCGVCAERYTRKKTKKKTIKSYSIKPIVKQKKILFKNKIAQVKHNNTPLRSGADKSYYIILNLKEYEVLELIALENEWFKVKVIRTEAIGFVHSKNIIILN